MRNADYELQRHLDVVEQALVRMKPGDMEQAEVTLNAIGNRLHSSATSAAMTHARLARLQLLAQQAHTILEACVPSAPSASASYTSAGESCTRLPAFLCVVEA